MRDTVSLTSEKQLVFKLSGVIAVLSLITLAVAFYFLPGINLSTGSFVFALSLGIIFFTLYLLLPNLYLNETFLMVSDALYIAVITYLASRAGDYGILILFLYFIVIAADALKYPISEYVFVVLLTVQAAFIYVILWAPFEAGAKFGILTIFLFCIISMAVFVWYAVYQFVHERSVRYVIEKKSRYLKAMNEHLQAVDEMRGNILNVTSHEFQTPLTVIRGSLSMLKHAGIDKLSPEQADLLQTAITNNERAIGLVKDLLTSTRLQSGEWEVIAQPFSLLDLVKTLVNDHQQDAKDKEIKFTANLPKDDIEVKADPNLLRISFKNLLNNAFKYTEKGGSVTVTLQKDDKELRYVVEDTGIGIPDDFLHQIFNRFTRSDNAILAQPDGFGIGLHYSQAIIKKHGGEITVKSKKGEGSTFTIHLPLSILLENQRIDQQTPVKQEEGNKS